MKFSLFLKGMFMGLCDLIPGISGGTIAFITGIYDEFIHSVRNLLSLSVLYELFIATILLLYPTKKHRTSALTLYKKYNLSFLITLFSGIVLAIFLGSYGVLYLLENFFVETMLFFIGLILSSSFLLFRTTKRSNLSLRFLAVIGFLLGASLLFLVPFSPSLSLGYVFLSGFLGISAMFLPGISGSYILYIMGSYEYILSSLHTFFDSYIVILSFILGVICGAIVISRIISYLLRRSFSGVMYFLGGFVIGALLIPIRDILLYGVNSLSLFIGSCLFVISFLFVYFFSSRASKKANFYK